jgi:hypothetical protein
MEPHFSKGRKAVVVVVQSLRECSTCICGSNRTVGALASFSDHSLAHARATWSEIEWQSASTGPAVPHVRPNHAACTRPPGEGRPMCCPRGRGRDDAFPPLLACPARPVMVVGILGITPSAEAAAASERASS